MEYYNDYNSSDDEFGNTTWELETNATWLFIDHEKGILSGTPGQNDVKTWWANITVTDDHGGKANRNFTILVIDLNSPPKIIIKNVTIAYTNKPYYMQFDAEDQDTPLANLSWELGFDTNATWLNIDPETGILSGTPQIRHGGHWFWVNVTVLDNEGGRDFYKFKLYVMRSPNEPPKWVESTLLENNEKTILAFKKWVHTFEAEDDYTPNDKLFWSLRSNTSWLSINSSSGEVQGNPQFKDVGIYWVNITVTDEDGLFNFTNFTLYVKHINQPPTLSHAGMTPLNGTNEDWFTFYVIYTDLDNDSGHVYIIIDNKSYTMTPERKSNLHYYIGVNFTFKIKLGPGIHTYYFEADDEWYAKAILDKYVPTRQSPAKTNYIKKVEHKEFYEEPICWVSGIVIIIIFLCVLQFVLKPLSKRYPKLEFVNKVKVPDQINPVVRYRKRIKDEGSGEFGFLCPNCKSLVPEDAVKCENCGDRFTMVEYLCPDCQAEVKGLDMFCPKCGSKFEELEEEELEAEDPEVDEEPDQTHPDEETEDSAKPPDKDKHASEEDDHEKEKVKVKEVHEKEKTKPDDNDKAEDQVKKAKSDDTEKKETKGVVHVAHAKPAQPSKK